MSTMNLEKHSQEISQSRIGGFGGSDADLFYHISQVGYKGISESDKKRILIAKGEMPYEQVSTDAMQLGHKFEDWYSEQHKDLEREKKLTAKLATNFDTFAHADFYQKGCVCELKCTMHTKDAYARYYNQLQWYYMLGAENVVLIIQDSSKDFGAIEEVSVQKDPKRIAELLNGITTLDKAWHSSIELGEIVMADSLLPFDKKSVMQLQALFMSIKAREKEIERIKADVLAFMEENNIKKIVNDYFSITYKPASTRKTFSSKDLFQAYPDMDFSRFEKESKVKASITIQTKESNEK